MDGFSCSKNNNEKFIYNLPCINPAINNPTLNKIKNKCSKRKLNYPFIL